MGPAKLFLYKTFAALFLIQTALTQQFPDDNEHLNRTLSGILKPRTIGTPGHTEVCDFITSELSELGFNTELDKFTDTTPIFGNVTFANVVGTINPNANKFLTLACHYDSKYFPENPEFVAAVDSAVPCSIILNVAKTLRNYLRSQEFKNQKKIGLKVMFFDGEEAVKDWTATDSLYGSRHLANKLSSTRSFTPSGSGTPIREIDRIAVLVLLDLIGAENPIFYGQFLQTAGLHQQLSDIENKFSKSSILENHNLMFLSHSPKNVSDDHLPFLERNVSVLHLIPVPFPPQWHQPTDDAEHLHWPTIRNFNKVLRQFVYEYLSSHSGAVNLGAFPYRLFFGLFIIIKFVN